MPEVENEGQFAELSEEEKARIRAEMRYALLAASEARPPERSRTGTEKILSYLSNGFVLLLLGSLITSGLVPYFQRTYEARARRAGQMEECFSQFLLYSNSIWQEYYAVLPLTQQTDLGREEYLKYVEKIAEVKLKRYEAYAKVQALALAYREKKDPAASALETALRDYAVQLNAVSAEIDRWLTGLYCTPTTREDSPCASFDPSFDAFAQYTKIKDQVVEIGNQEADQVAALMVDRMQGL